MFFEGEHRTSELRQPSINILVEKSVALLVIPPSETRCVGYLAMKLFLKGSYYDRYSTLVLRAAEADDLCSDSAAEPRYAATKE